MKPHERILVAVDTQDEKRARSRANELEGVVGGLKLGLELFTACDPALVREIVSLGIPVFLDLKLHDIPNTVMSAAGSTTRVSRDAPVPVSWATNRPSGLKWGLVPS